MNYIIECSKQIKLTLIHVHIAKMMSQRIEEVKTRADQTVPDGAFTSVEAVKEYVNGTVDRWFAEEFGENPDSSSASPATVAVMFCRLADEIYRLFPAPK